MKTCSRCGYRKHKSCFGKRSRLKDGLCYHCKECENSRCRERYRKNREKERLRKNIYYHENQELVASQQHESYSKNKKTVLITRKLYAQNNKEKRRNWAHNRKAKKLNQPGFVPDNIEEILWKEQAGLCFYCSINLSSVGFHRDHKIPLAKGGAHDSDNLCLACPSCNVRKHTKTAEQFMEALLCMIESKPLTPK